MSGTLPPLPTVSIEGVELLMPGTFEGVRGGRLTYDTGDIDAAVAAFHELKPLFTPRAKIGHNDKQALLAADELPAAGRITNAYRKGDRLVVDVDHVPAKFAQLIKAGAYGDRSAELLLNTDINGKTYPMVLKGFAWLGATPPAIAGLADIEALYARDEENARFQGGTVAVVHLAAAHAPLTGTHEHPHPAFGSQGEDATHEHEHEHGADGTPDANHDHMHEAMMAEAPTKSEAGKSFYKGDYAYTPSDSPSDWKLRLTNTPGGAPDAGIVGAAAAALGKGFRGQKVDIPSADRPGVIAKVRAAWKKANPDKKADELPDVLKESASHSRLAALARLLRLAPDVALELEADEVTDAGLLQQAIKLIEQFIMREAQEQVDGEDEDDDIRGALAARDILQQIAQCEMAEAAGLDSDHDDNAGMVAAYYSTDMGEDAVSHPALLSALDTIKAHLDSTGKRTRGVGMARVAHRMLTSYAGGFVKAAPLPVGVIGPDGETGGELAGGVAVAHARGEESMQDQELRALLGLDEHADLKQALLALKGRSVDLAKYDAVVDEFRAFQERQAKAEAERIVELAIDQHKLAPNLRDWATEQALKDRTSFEVFLAGAPATAWPAGEVGSAGNMPGAPVGLSTPAAEVARKLGISMSDMAAAASQTQSLEERAAEARKQAVAATYRNGRA